jgi:nicotinate-nucleotide adenylyltransferase
MLRLATGGQAAFVVSTMELDRGGISYTVDTLEALQDQFPQSELFLLIGSDSLADLPTWREPARICELAMAVVVRRAGGPPTNFDAIANLVAVDRLKAIRGAAVEMPLVEFSASDIRRRVAAGSSIRYRTPRAVEQYIAADGLYRGVK